MTKLIGIAASNGFTRKKGEDLRTKILRLIAIRVHTVLTAGEPPRVVQGDLDIEVLQPRKISTLMFFRVSRQGLRVE